MSGRAGGLRGAESGQRAAGEGAPAAGAGGRVGGAKWQDFGKSLAGQLWHGSCNGTLRCCVHGRQPAGLPARQLGRPQDLGAACPPAQPTEPPETLPRLPPGTPGQRQGQGRGSLLQPWAAGSRGRPVPRRSCTSARCPCACLCPGEEPRAQELGRGELSVPDQRLVMIPSPKLLRVSPNLGSSPPSHFAGLLCFASGKQIAFPSAQDLSPVETFFFFFPRRTPSGR